MLSSFLSLYKFDNKELLWILFNSFQPRLHNNHPSIKEICLDYFGPIINNYL